MQNILSGITNQLNVADNILVGGSQQEHDNTLHQVVSVLAQHSISVTVGCRCELYKTQSCLSSKIIAK